MNNEIEQKPLSGTLKFRISKIPEVEADIAEDVSNNSNVSNSSNTEDTSIPSIMPKLGFNAIYDLLHGKFPEIINMEQPVLLAVGIRKEMSKETGVSSVILKKWI